MNIVETKVARLNHIALILNVKSISSRSFSIVPFLFELNPKPLGAIILAWLSKLMC